MDGLFILSHIVWGMVVGKITADRDVPIGQSLAITVIGSLLITLSYRLLIG